MQQHKQDYKPILVTDPHTGELIDVLPFLKNIDELGSGVDLRHSIENMEERIEDIFAILTLYFTEEFIGGGVSNYTSIMQTLHYFKKMYKTITVFQKTK